MQVTGFSARNETLVGSARGCPVDRCFARLMPGGKFRLSGHPGALDQLVDHAGFGRVVQEDQAGLQHGLGVVRIDASGSDFGKQECLAEKQRSA